MTREEARKAAEVMMAYADGKNVEFNDCYDDGKWMEDHSPVFDWTTIDYRIKKEPTYRPFKDRDECWAEMQKHQPFGWIQEKNSKIYEIANKIGGCPDGIDGLDYFQMFHYFNFADGTPFGIKEG